MIFMIFNSIFYQKILIQKSKEILCLSCKTAHHDLFMQKTAKIYIISVMLKSQDKHGTSNNLVRKVLKEIIADDIVPMSQRGKDFQAIKMNQAVSYLERKIDRQQSEIQMISRQMTEEIEIKEQLAVLLNEEKAKNIKLSQQLSNCNKSNYELKKRVAKLQTLQTYQSKFKNEYELKLAKMKQSMKKKDQQIIKQQQRLSEIIKYQDNMLEIEEQLKTLRGVVLQTKQREDELQEQVQRLNTQLCEKDEQIIKKQQIILFSQEHLRRLRDEYQELQQDQIKQQNGSRLIQIEMKTLLDRQNQEIRRLNLIIESNPHLQSDLQNYKQGKQDYYEDYFTKVNVNLFDQFIKDNIQKCRLLQDKIEEQQCITN